MKGGFRTGAGAKGLGQMTTLPDPELSEEPPSDLPEEQQAFWRKNAPLAIENGTLRKQTEQAFRLLCEQDAEKTAVWRQIVADGRTFLKVTVDGAGVEHRELKRHTLYSVYTTLNGLIRVGLKDFNLSAFGKPLAALPKKPLINRFAHVVKATGHAGESWS
jgi:hypothetical protein